MLFVLGDIYNNYLFKGLIFKCYVMKKKKKSTRQILEPHSAAKVELYRIYLSIYLNILYRVDFIENIYLYDLFAGEGVYEDGGKGSPIVTAETIKNHYFYNNKSCKDIELFLNDYGYSEIEEDKLKIDRVKENIDPIFLPENVRVNYSNKEYVEIFQEVKDSINKMKDNERALLFLDPWGYKNIKPYEIKELLSNGKTELLLFLPISFMYRFAAKVVKESFRGGEALERFINDLFEGETPNTTNPINFIISVKERFKEYLHLKYVDTFTLRPDRNNIFCVYYFTNSKLGFVKMLYAKWRVDMSSGKGYESTKALGLFEEFHLSNYDQKLKKYIIESDGKTNLDITEYGYNEGFLPKHSNAILKGLLKSKVIEIISLDGGKPAGFYLDRNDRNVLIRKVEK